MQQSIKLPPVVQIDFDKVLALLDAGAMAGITGESAETNPYILNCRTVGQLIACREWALGWQIGHDVLVKDSFYTKDGLDRTLAKQVRFARRMKFGAELRRMADWRRRHLEST